MTDASDGDRRPEPTLAVVLIARNQVWNVERLVRSVRDEPRCRSADVVLADSASDDGTPRLAQQLGVRVVGLDPGRRLTAAAGRVAGQEATRGDYVLFLDGDMELAAGWLGPAIDYLEAHPEVAGIAGRVLDLPRSWEGPGREEDGAGSTGGASANGAGTVGVRASDKVAVDPSDPGGRSAAGGAVLDPVTVPFVAGASLYRRAALDAVGSFDTALYSDEEPELGLRLRAAGYTLVQERRLMAFHFTDPPDRLLTTFRRWRRNLYLGAGQIVRKHLGRPYLGVWLRERGFFIPPALAFLALLLAVAAWAATGRATLVVAWVVAMVLVVLGLAWRRRSLESAAETILERLFHLDGLVRGFFAYRRDRTG